VIKGEGAMLDFWKEEVTQDPAQQEGKFKNMQRELALKSNYADCLLGLPNLLGSKYSALLSESV
jgi:hypothetical protein